MEKIVDRIRKLLALASSANENEAMAAAEKAQALLLEYNLTMADVESEPEQFISDDEFESDSRPWRRSLATAIAQLYFCDYHYQFVKYTSRRACGYKRMDRHYFHGAPHNVAVAKSVFVYLCGTINRLAKEGSMQCATRQRVSYVTSFQHTCSARLSQRLTQKYYELMGQHQAIGHHNKNMPALYNETKEKLDSYLSAKYSDLTPVEYQPKLASVQGAHDGRSAGDDISLDIQISQEASQFMLPKS